MGLAYLELVFAEGVSGTGALAAQAAPAEQSVAEPQVEAKKAAGLDGAEVAAPTQGPCCSSSPLCPQLAPCAHKVATFPSLLEAELHSSPVCLASPVQTPVAVHSLSEVELRPSKLSSPSFACLAIDLP